MRQFMIWPTASVLRVFEEDRKVFEVDCVRCRDSRGGEVSFDEISFGLTLDR